MQGMTMLIIVGIIVLSWPCISGCSKQSEELDEEYDVDVKRASAKLISVNTGFGFRLLSELAQQDADKNIFISPLSIEIALAMTYNGAEGETQQAMAKTLELEGMSLQEVNYANASLIAALKNLDHDVQLEMANSLWAREGEEFNPDFIKNNEVPSAVL